MLWLACWAFIEEGWGSDPRQSRTRVQHFCSTVPDEFKYKASSRTIDYGRSDGKWKTEAEKVKSLTLHTYGSLAGLAYVTLTTNCIGFPVAFSRLLSLKC